MLFNCFFLVTPFSWFIPLPSFPTFVLIYNFIIFIIMFFFMTLSFCFSILFYSGVKPVAFPSVNLRTNNFVRSQFYSEQAFILNRLLWHRHHKATPTQGYFSFQPVLHDWCNKGCGMCYPVWDDAYKRTLAANRKE